MIYEFDPADIMYSYMYPAMVRTLSAQPAFNGLPSSRMTRWTLPTRIPNIRPFSESRLYPAQGNQHENSFRGSTKPEERRILRKLSTRYVVR